MFFQIYGETAGWQILGWLLVFVGLVVMNEFARRTKVGGLICFGAIPIALTIYFLAILIASKTGAEWVQTNATHLYMNGWFHYAKLYAATTGCIGFMIIKYHWGKLGKAQWFKAFPFVIVAINILIAVASDFESAIKGFMAAGDLGGGWWYSSEHVWLYGGWWNVLNGIAGILNIFCMTAWWSVYTSKDGKDMLWPDMTWCFIIAYDVWNFEYTYLNLPTHAWYCGLALLLAPTFANAFWNKGGWIQNRANTLALWCMFAQVVPLFQDGGGRFSVLPSLYSGEVFSSDEFWVGGFQNEALELTSADASPELQGVIAVLALAANVICLAAIIKRAKKLGVNPYKHDVFADQKDHIEATARIADGELAA